MKLRPASRADSQRIEQLFTQTFSDSDGAAEGARVGRLARRLMDDADTDQSSGFVALDNELLVGCIFFSPLTFDIPTRAALLSPVSVSTGHQGQGIGQQLIRFGIEHMRKNGTELIFTYGDPNYYAKVGFNAVSQTTARAPFELSQPEGWLGQSLTGADIQPLPGSARCVAAFNEPELW